MDYTSAVCLGFLSDKKMADYSACWTVDSKVGMTDALTEQTPVAVSGDMRAVQRVVNSAENGAASTAPSTADLSVDWLVLIEEYE